MKKHYRKENDCANCGTGLEGKFCHKCGQENLELKENFGHMMTHAISDYFHFDHQFFHTLKPLVFEPGKLTNEYMAGRRVQYLHPVKMYIFISLVYFVLLFQSKHDVIKVKQTGKKQTNKEMAKVNKELDSAINDPNVPDYAKIFIRKAKEKNEARLKDSTLLSGSKKSTIEKHAVSEDSSEVFMDNEMKSGRLPGASKERSYQAYLAAQQKLPNDKKDMWLERMYNKKSFAYQDKYGEKGREMFFEDFKHNIPKMMFLLLPLCALIFKLAFWRNKKFYVEHLIFTFHLHCFIFLFLAVVMLLQRLLPDAWDLDDWLGFAAFLGINWYIYRAFRTFYQRSKWRTISKMFGVANMYFLTFSFCILILLVITAVL
jgi:hypothetical protein